MKPLYPTNINNARRCWRRWAGKSLFRVRTEPREYDTQLGTEVHDLAERWQKLGEAPVPDRSVADNLFIAGLPYAPAPKTGASEKERTLVLNGISYALRRDWEGMLSQLPRGDSEASMRVYGDIPAQLDYKTASQPFRYGLWDRESWMDDTQAVLESVELSERTGSEVVSSRWLYFAKPRRKDDGSYPLRGKMEAMPSDLVAGRDQLNRAHLKIVEPYAQGMLALQTTHSAGKIQDFREIPYNLSACDDYASKTNPNGCEFRALCAGHQPVDQLVAAGFSGGADPLADLQRFLAHKNGAPSQQSTQTQPQGDEMSLFAQLNLGQAPAPVNGIGLAPAPAAPSFTPPPAQGPAFGPPPGAPAPVQAAPSTPAFAPPAAPQAYIKTPDGMYVAANAPVVIPPPAHLIGQVPATVLPAQSAPVAAPVFSAPPAPVAAPSFAPPPTPGFTGINAPELRQAPPPAPAPVPAPQPLPPATIVEAVKANPPSAATYAPETTWTGAMVEAVKTDRTDGISDSELGAACRVILRAFKAL